MTSVYEYYYDTAGRLTSVEKDNVVTDCTLVVDKVLAEDKVILTIEG